MPQRDIAVRVPIGHHLALLGELEMPAQRVRGAGEDGSTHGTPAATDGAAPAVEQRQPHTVAGGRLGELGFRAVKQPGRGEGARLLGRVGIAQHDLLVATASVDLFSIDSITKECIEHPISAFQRGRGLEEGHDVEARGIEAGSPGQGHDVEDILGLAGEADDVAPTGLGPEAGLDVGDGAERLEHLASADAIAHLDALGLPLVAVRGPGQCLDRCPMDLAVLADLQRQGMEPERLDLPAQRLDLAVGDTRQAVLDEALLELDRSRRGARPAMHSRCPVHVHPRGGGASAGGARRCCRSRSR